ncbi:hypothetical protein GS597_07155 [Synechococcales cyanobacterium C]|uniref:Uncharacterized protein n=1 Tax=Petrachloros mirabilis ULC683 TaxID=2781853 RepID=A0A8K1ZZ10_9CYAN|nr:hypothetical protein [Petrachloros mirabilis]NCJ06292.1 hypothetical protein [Petrachloros mirabilis ULC683]
MSYKSWMNGVALTTLVGLTLAPLLILGDALQTQAATLPTEAYGSCSVPSDLDSVTPPETVPQTETVPQPSASLRQLIHTQQGIRLAAADPANSEYFAYAPFDFSAAESDAAVALFGCDCPLCIGVLRQMRRQVSAAEGSDGHCMAALQRRKVTTDQIQRVLQQLEAEEAL